MAADSTLVLRGVRVHNLQSIDVDLPLGKLTVVTGVSGAGKTSLVFDTLSAEAQRRYLQSLSAHTRQALERFEQPDADFIGDLPPAIALDARPPSSRASATVGSLTEIDSYLQLLFAREGQAHCVRCGRPIAGYTPTSILARVAAAPAGARLAIGFAVDPGADDWQSALREEGFVRVQVGGDLLRLGEVPLPLAETPWVLVDRLEVGRDPERWREAVDLALQRGQGRLKILGEALTQLFDRVPYCEACDLAGPALEPRLFDRQDPVGACETCGGTGCADCAGSGFNPTARAVRWAEHTIADVGAMPVRDLAHLPALASAGVPGEQIAAKIDHLVRLGLGHLSVQLPASTLTSGELRRVRLAAALGSSLVQTLYAIEEPSVGLRADELPGLIAQLRELCQAGNTLVVIEHEREIIAAADHVLDLGPRAGEEGGRVLYQGPPAGLAEVEDSLTAEFLREPTSPASAPRRKPHGELRLDDGFTLPLGVLSAATGHGALRTTERLTQAFAAKAYRCSGGGRVEELVVIDQQPLARGSRSSAVTVMKIYDDIRALFAETSDAKIRNLGPGAFSTNQPGGRCETCEGQGTLTVDLQFLADVHAVCPECRGKRFQNAVLDVKVRGLSIAEVLEFTAREAFRFFRAQPKIERRLKWLLDVGLEPIRLGQPADTLSGGESQRLKLAAHLASARKSRTLFVLLEPSAGLHPADLLHLDACFSTLLQTGHTLLAFDHRRDFLQLADVVVELQPDVPLQLAT